jgi:hypothetical protein
MGPLNLNEASSKIKQVGTNRVRVVPMPGENFKSGKHQIEINEGNTWRPIVVGIDQTIANNLVINATNNTICG